LLFVVIPYTTLFRSVWTTWKTRIWPAQQLCPAVDNYVHCGPAAAQACVVRAGNSQAVHRGALKLHKRDGIAHSSIHRTAAGQDWRAFCLIRLVSSVTWL